MLLTELKQEITNDPEGIGYQDAVTHGQDGVVADLLNDKRFELNTYVPISVIESYIDANGLRDGIEDAAVTTPPNPAAKAIVRLFQARYDTIDLSLPAATMVVQGLLQSNLISAQNATDVNNLGKVPASRAEILWGLGTFITAERVGYSLRS